MHRKVPAVYDRVYKRTAWRNTCSVKKGVLVYYIEDYLRCTTWSITKLHREVPAIYNRIYKHTACRSTCSVHKAVLSYCIEEYLQCTTWFITRVLTSKIKVWIYHCQTTLQETRNMFRQLLRDTFPSVFEAWSLTNSGKSLGIVWKFAPRRSLG